MPEPGDSVYEDVYGVEQLESELRDGDSAFREIVRILMDEDNPPDDDRGPRSLSQHSYGHDEGHWSSREYAQLIRDGIFCLSFIAVLLSVLIIIILRSNKTNRQPSASLQGEYFVVLLLESYEFSPSPEIIAFQKVVFIQSLYFRRRRRRRRTI